MSASLAAAAPSRPSAPAAAARTSAAVSRSRAGSSSASPASPRSPTSSTRGRADAGLLVLRELEQPRHGGRPDVEEREHRHVPRHPPLDACGDERLDRLHRPDAAEAAGRGRAHVAVPVVEGLEQRRDGAGRAHVAEREGSRGALPPTPVPQQAQLLVDGAGALEVRGDPLARRAADGERVAAEELGEHLGLEAAQRRRVAHVLDELDRGGAKRLHRCRPPSPLCRQPRAAPDEHEEERQRADEHDERADLRWPARLTAVRGSPAPVRGAPAG